MKQDSLETKPEQTSKENVLAKQVSHREFLKMCGLALVAAGAGQLATPPRSVSAETFADLIVTGYTYLATTSGNVGIGTTEPADLLHLKGAYPVIRLQPSGAGNQQAGISLRNNADTGGFGIGRDANNNGTNDFFIYDQTAGISRMYINSSGNVGIGTTSPQARLQVEGNMNLNGELWVNGTRVINSDGTLNGGGGGTANSAYYAP